MSKIVTRAIDLSNPPKLSEEAKSRLAKLNEAEIEPPRDCRRPKTLRQYPYEKQTIPNRS